MLCVFALLGAAAKLPALPVTQYTATAYWSECGNVPPCVKPADHRRISIDGEKAMKAIMMNTTKTGDVFHQVQHGATKYKWGPGAGGCTSNAYQFPVESDWAWLTKNSTTGPTTVTCIGDPTKKCELWEGTWPEQVTSDVKLTVRPAENGEHGPMPDHLVMTCALFPFTIYKNFTSLTRGPPPASAFALDASCPKPPAIRLAAPPKTKEEAIATGRLGPYTDIMRRYLAKRDSSK